MTPGVSKVSKLSKKGSLLKVLKPDSVSLAVVTKDPDLPLTNDIDRIPGITFLEDECLLWIAMGLHSLKNLDERLP